MTRCDPDLAPTCCCCCCAMCVRLAANADRTTSWQHRTMRGSSRQSRTLYRSTPSRRSVGGRFGLHSLGYLCLAPGALGYDGWGQLNTPSTMMKRREPALPQSALAAVSTCSTIPADTDPIPPRTHSEYIHACSPVPAPHPLPNENVNTGTHWFGRPIDRLIAGPPALTPACLPA